MKTWEGNKSLSPIKGAIIVYLLTNLIPFFGLVLGRDYLQLSSNRLAKKRDLPATFANWDGEWYVKIAQNGYHYDPRVQSSVAFFPAYPLLGEIISRGTGLRIDVALFLVSQFFLGGSFILIGIYFRNRQPALDDREMTWALLAFGLWPMTVFWRMAYSESLFLFIGILVLYGMERRWPLVLIALLIGFGTAVRSVGVALTLPFFLHLWGQSGSYLKRFLTVLFLLPLSCWGLAAYMGYQASAFGTPLAFVKTQDRWTLRRPGSTSEKILAVATLEPFWSPFSGNGNPGSGEAGIFLFDMRYLNPIFFLAVAGLIGIGAWKKWLTRNEIALAAGLLAIPYVSRSYEMYMEGFGRFASVVFPAYLVVGRLLMWVSAPWATALLAVSGFMLGALAALFAAWYPVI